MRELARARVAELAGGDVELLELLAKACAEGAIMVWTGQAPPAGVVAFEVRGA
jgi:hypothetical protein